MRRPKKVNRDIIEVAGLDKKLKVSGTRISSRSSETSEGSTQNKEREECCSRISHKHPICVYTNTTKGGATADTTKDGGYSYNYPGCNIGSYSKLKGNVFNSVKHEGNTLMLNVSTVKLHTRKNVNQ